MAGTRHHFIPRFLQKQFSTKRNKDFYVWLHRKDGTSFNPNIINVGVSKDYYKVDESLDADSEMDSYESAYAEVLAGLRKGENISAAKIAEFIAHMEVRTANLRCSLEDVAAELAAFVGDTFSDPAQLNLALGSALSPDAPVMIRAIEKSCADNGLDANLVIAMVQANPRLMEVARSQAIEQMAHHMFLAKTMFAESVKAAAKSAHVKVLAHSMSPEAKAQSLSHLEYRLVATEAEIPLGDSVVLFQVNGSRQFKAFLEKSDQLIAVYLPVSPNEVLVGSADENYQFDHDVVSVELVKASRDFFITSSPIDESCVWKTEIGKNSFLMEQGLGQTIMSEQMVKLIESGSLRD